MTATDSASPRDRSRDRRFSVSSLLRPETTLIAVILVVASAATIRNPNFINPGNLIDIARAAVIYFIMACGASLLMIGGGLDFSVGSVFTLGGLTTAWMLTIGMPWPFAICIGILAGMVAGYANILVVAKLHVPPIIATLGTFFIISGLCIVVTGGQDILPLPATFQRLGQGSIFGVPFVVLYALVVGLAFWFLLERTPFGVEVRALGGNRKAAIANGLQVGRIETILYVLASAMAALAGIIYTARVGSGQVAAGGSAVTLTVVTAALIGGISLLGGLGSITGVAVGALLLSEIDNALIVASVPPQYNSIIVGLILITAVAVDHLRRERLYKTRR